MATKNTILDWRFIPIKSRRKFYKTDLSGTKIEKLWVIGIAGRYKRLIYWLCECDCGEFVFISTGQLTRTDWRRTRSCGCIMKQPKSHGYAKTKVYRTWSYIKDRCLNPKNQDYANYGGAGITIHKDWINSFETFLAHVGEPPSPKHSIDRWPSKTGNYEPGNVRWATAKEQARNKTNNKMLTFQGQTLCLAEWAEILDIDQDTLGMRLLSGWTTERALSTPLLNQLNNLNS